MDLEKTEEAAESGLTDEFDKLSWSDLAVDMSLVSTI